jgi:hypothetical protein
MRLLTLWNSRLKLARDSFTLMGDEASAKADNAHVLDAFS